MGDVTQILDAIDQGDPSASEQLLPLVYEELRVLARQRLANEKTGQSLQATALVHEAYLRMVGNENGQCWNSRGHFFGAAAKIMRRLLRNVAEDEVLGDTTTLADPGVVASIKARYLSSAGEEE